MNRFRTAAGLTAATAVIAAGSLFGGTAQAHALPFTQSVSIGSAATSVGVLANPNASLDFPTIQAGPWNWVCGKIGKYIGPWGCR